MSIFQDLCTKFSKQEDVQTHHVSNVISIASRIANGFGKHIGAPEPQDESNGKNYIMFYDVKYDPTGKSLLSEVANLRSALQVDEEGYAEFAFGLTLERGPRTYPKKNFYWVIRFLLRDDETCDLEIGFNSEKLKVDFKNPNSYERIYDVLLAQLTRYLERKPGDTDLQNRMGCQVIH